MVLTAAPRQQLRQGRQPPMPQEQKERTADTNYEEQRTVELFSAVRCFYLA